MRGTAHPPELRERARSLRAEGKVLREIAAELGAARSTVSAWLTDPDAAKAKARRERYAGSCETCGAATDGSCGPDKGPRHCHKCAPAASTIWTRETVVAAIQRFAERYGRQPSATDFNPSYARVLGHDWRAERFYSDGDYPHIESTRGVFGTWNAAITAAGFSPRARGGQYPRSPGSKKSAELEAERA